MKKFSAFTLVEIMLVIVILGVIAGLSIPNLSQTYNKFLLEQTVSDISNLMRYAQGRAIAQRKIIQLNLDADKKHYWLQERSAPEQEEKPSSSFQPIQGRLGRIFLIPREIVVSAENNTINFSPDGGIDKTTIVSCLKKRCLTISTKEQRGYVLVLEDNSLSPENAQAGDTAH